MLYEVITAETVKVYLRPRPRLKKPVFEFNFTELAIKGRQSMGNVLTKYAVHKIVLKDEGVSTLGGRKIWFEEEVLRLNADGRGNYLGEFHGDDKILVVTKSGKYRLCSYDLMNHFEDDKHDSMSHAHLLIVITSYSIHYTKLYEM